MNYKTALEYARKNRKNPTKTEVVFWNNVRGKKLLGLKINRQYVFEYKLYPTDSNKFFIADFYCHQLKLVIELDGRIHDYQKDYDRNREDILQGLGLKVIRFANEDILYNWKIIENTLKELVSD